MIEGKTKTGFAYSVSENIVKDYRYVRAVAKLRKGDNTDKFLAFDTLSTLLLGDRVEDLITHVETLHDGFAPIEAVATEMNEIIEACVPKNSPSSQES